MAEQMAGVRKARSWSWAWRSGTSICSPPPHLEEHEIEQIVREVVNRQRRAGVGEVSWTSFNQMTRPPE